MHDQTFHFDLALHINDIDDVRRSHHNKVLDAVLKEDVEKVTPAMLCPVLHDLVDSDEQGAEAAMSACIDASRAE